MAPRSSKLAARIEDRTARNFTMFVRTADPLYSPDNRLLVVSYVKRLPFIQPFVCLFRDLSDVNMSSID